MLEVARPGTRCWPRAVPVGHPGPVQGEADTLGLAPARGLAAVGLQSPAPAPAPLVLGHALPGGLRGPGRGEEAGGFEGEVLERDGGVQGHGVRHQAHAALLRGVHTQGLGQSSSHGLDVMGACLDDSDQEHYVMS